MKIYELGMHGDAGSGGVDRYFAGLLSGLAECGADVTSATFGPAPASPENALSLGPKDSGLLARWQAIRAFGRAINSCDLLATHFALYAFPLAHHRNHVVHFHGPWALESAREGEPFWKILPKFALEKSVYGRAKKLIVLSEAFRQILRQRYRVPDEKIAVVPGGIDVARFQPSDRGEARQKMGWPLEGRIILCVRRLVQRMGLENLLDAFAMISAPDVCLVIGGTGAIAAKLKERSDKLGLANRVIFSGFIAEDDLATAYAAADFSIVPSVALEGFGLVVLESLACGTPALVTPVGGLPEVVSGLDSSLIMAGTQPEDMTAAIRRALDDPASLPGPEACRDHARRFAWKTIAGRILNVYEEAARG